MRKKEKPVLSFNDSKLPVNTLTPKRIEEIEKLMIPRLKDAIFKLRKEKPYLFKSSSSK